MTTKHIYAKETAKIIRKELKNNFPETKFSVTSSRDSVDISWIDGDSYDTVEALCNSFQGKRFDGTQDLEVKQTSIWQGEKVCFCNYVSCYRRLSKDFAQKILAYCIDQYYDDDNLNIAAVKLDVSEKNNQASFDCSMCLDENYETTRKIRKISDQTNVYDTVDWATKSTIIKQKELEEKELLQQREVDKQKFINNLECPLPEPEMTALVFDDRSYVWTGTKPIVRSNPEDDTWICDRWVYTFKDARGEECCFEAAEVEFAVNPVTPLSITGANFWFMGKLACFNKNPTLEDYKELCARPKEQLSDLGNEPWEYQPCLVVERIELSPEDYDRFVDNLMLNQHWLEAKGGGGKIADLPTTVFDSLTKEEQELWWEAEYYFSTVAIVAKNRETFLVDPEGFSHARYVVVVDGKINEELNLPKPSQKDEGEAIEQNLQSIYKYWVESLIDKDRLSEIIGYQEWLNKYRDKILQEQYEQFISKCLSEGSINQIVSFENWKTQLQINK